MGFDELFEQHSKHNKHNAHHQYRNEYDSHHKYKHDKHDNIKQLIEKLRNNPKLKTLLIIIALALVCILILIVIVLFPLLMKILQFITENGIQGIIDTIWNGTKK